MRKGMTLMEILVAVGLVALLAGLMSLAVLDARRRARDGEKVSAARQAQAAVETYRAKHASYPGKTSDLSPEDAALAAAYGYQAEPAGCSAESGDTCRAFLLTFTLEGRVGTLPGGTCELRPGAPITCARP